MTGIQKSRSSDPEYASLARDSQPASTSTVSDNDQIAIVDVLAFIRRRSRIIASSAVIVLIITTIVLFIRDRKYTSSASFVPQASNQLSALAGLAAQFGVTAGGPDVTESPAFYVDLLRSREILTNVLQASYSYSADGRSETHQLLDVLRVSEPTAGRRLEKGIEKLNDRLQVDQKARTGVVALQVTLSNPQLAQEVAQNLMTEVSRFSVAKKNAKATAERQFTDRRVAELKTELRDGEDRLQDFLQQNRNYANAPALAFQHERLQQDVDFLRTIYTSVAQSNERAKMEEARDTPVIMVLEKPSLPAKPESRGLAKYGALAMLGGAFLGMALGLGADLMNSQRRRIPS